MKASLLLASLASGASATIYYAGVALSSGEFGVWSPTATKGTGLPGRFGVEYAFMNKAGVDTYVDRNHVNLFRVAFLLERMCPLATGLGAKFDETHFGHFKEAVDYITKTKGACELFLAADKLLLNDRCIRQTTDTRPSLRLHP